MSLTINRNNIYQNDVVGNVRKVQEDCCDWKETPNGDVFVVCDGMGGHVGGKKASETAVESILAFLNKEKYNNPIEALNGALQFANTQIIGYASEHPEFKGMGTTACVLLFQGDEAWIAHVGDSRIYLYLGKEKELHRITVDHSYVQMLVDKGLLDEEQAETDPNKNRILKALGVTTKLEPTFNFQNKPILPKNDDIFLICSDGLSGMIPDKTIEKVLAQKDLTLEKKGEQLITLAMEGETVKPGGQDNCTVELIKVDNSPWKKSEFKSYNPGKKKFSITGGFGSGKKGLSSKLIAAVIVVLLLVLGIGGWLIFRSAKHNRLTKDKNELIESLEKFRKEEKSCYDRYIKDSTYYYTKCMEKNKSESDLLQAKDFMEDSMKKLNKKRTQIDSITKRIKEINAKLGVEQ